MAKALKDLDQGDYVIQTKEIFTPVTPVGPARKEIVADRDGMVLKICKRVDDENFIVTDGFYMYMVWINPHAGDASPKWMVFDTMAAALMEQEYGGALRPSREMLRWSITVGRQSKIEEGIAMETLVVKALHPAGGLLITNKAMFPREVLNYLGLQRTAKFTYANVHALTCNVKEVSWSRISSQALHGHFKLRDFRMTAESLK